MFSFPFKSLFVNYGKICAIELSWEFAIHRSVNPCTKFGPSFKAKNTFSVVNGCGEFT